MQAATKTLTISLTACTNELANDSWDGVNLQGFVSKSKWQQKNKNIHHFASHTHNQIRDSSLCLLNRHLKVV